MTNKRNYYQIRASYRWRNAQWIEGAGPFSVAAHCTYLRVALFPTLPAAVKYLNRIEKWSCGHSCGRGMHFLDTVYKRDRKLLSEARPLLEQYDWPHGPVFVGGETWDIKPLQAIQNSPDTDRIAVGE